MVMGMGFLVCRPSVAGFPPDTGGRQAGAPPIESPPVCPDVFFQPMGLDRLGAFCIINPILTPPLAVIGVREPGSPPQLSQIGDTESDGLGFLRKIA